jgi:hypothetical protein
MPQTIALQRGTTTLTGDGTTSVTLFTQSGGIATRVIVNQLSFFFSSALDANADMRGIVYHQSSGGQGSVLGILKNTQGTTSLKAVQFPVGSFTNNPWTGLSPTATALPFMGVPYIGSTNATEDMLTSPTGSVNNTYSSTSNERGSAITQNFYIGPGDSIRIKFNARTNVNDVSTPTTVNIGYSFTTITET